MNAPSLPPRHDRMPMVSEVCGDDAEVLALSVARFVAAGYITSDVARWDAAFDGAERLLGAAEGGRFVSCVVGIVRALRSERDAEWSFMPATCCRLTGHECALVGLIGHGRRRLWDEVGLGAAAITGRDAAPRLVAAVRNAVAAIDSAAGRLGGTAPRRPRAALH
ncbi:hypothetical protein [uncultured Methylobacterium sp.]|uniref:hypothetical protein n=1 Tax=uncultured Methylobacterium sp. TaxID=157278 RepID=UPI0035CC21E1